MNNEEIKKNFRINVRLYGLEEAVIMLIDEL